MDVICKILARDSLGIDDTYYVCTNLPAKHDTAKLDTND